MKKIFLLSIITSFCYFISAAQMKDNSYKKQWLAIDSLILEKSLPKTALKKVNLLYTDAKTKGQKDQVIKALLYKMSLQSQVNDEDPNLQITVLQKEITNAQDAVQKSILQVLLAERYNVYLNNYGWRIYQRSTTVNFKKEDIATWSADDFNHAIATLYAKALRPEKQLQQTSLKPYKAIIIKGNTEKLRPTLYDLLAHKILDYYKNSNAYITKPSYAFEIKAPEALGTTDTFLKQNFKAADSSSNLLMALHLFQQLMHFHNKDVDASAFIDVNLERIEWVHENSIIENKEALYKQALEEITGSYAGNTNTIQAWYLLAKIYANNAATYQPFGDTAYRYDYNKAKEIIDEQLKAKTKANEGSSNLKQLLSDILRKELHTQTESINVPGQPFRMLVNYRNSDTMYLRIIKAEKLKKITEQRWDENYWRQVIKLPAEKKFIQFLPETKDFQKHSVEIKIDALTPGSYAVLASTGKDFNSSSDKMIIQYFDVSAISFINNGADYFVVNRETGQPLKDVKVKYEIQDWDYKQGKLVILKSGSKTPDENGFFTLDDIKTSNERNVALSFSTGNDTLNVRNTNYYYPYQNFVDKTDPQTEEAYEKENTTIFFFTDRSIYRPGQTVFFKGIGVAKDKNSKQSKMLQYKDSIQAILKDVNNKAVDSITVTFNEFGSFSGKFMLPQNVLTGNFSIVTNTFNGNANFSVEEYKRPKFYVEFDTLKTTYRLNDTIKITGHAKAYAGNNIDGGQVKFNVQRNTRFMYPWMFWRSIRPVSRPQQITEGTVTTDADGKFEITFIAGADESINKNTDPVFDFAVEANVTDINGETRDGNTNISIGYKSLQLQLNIPEIADAAAFKSIGITAQNLSGQKVPAEIHLAVYPLQTPEKLYRERKWERPDVFAISKEIFEANFPYDEYEEENDYHNWKKKAAVIMDTINTETTTNYKLQTTNLQQGWYAVEAIAKDKDGNEVKDVKYIQLYDLQSASLPSLQSNWSKELANAVQPGEQAKLLVATNEQDAFIIQNIKHNKEKADEGNDYSFYQLSNNKKLLTLDVKTEDRNGIGLYYAFVKHNRFYTGGMAVQIPYLDKDLEINYTTFRNKTEPGSKEEWTVQIKGSKGEKAAAELLTTMYDASLDQFKPHAWYKPDVWQTFSTYNSFNANDCFGINNSEENYLQNNIEGFSKQYDELATSGEDLWGEVEKGNYSRGKSKSPDAAIAVIDRDGNSDMARKIEITKFTPPLIVADEEVSMSDTISFDMKTKPSAKENTDLIKIQPRKNFTETAFFFPQLYADKDGNYSFSFTMPEALTQWKWMSLAHTKELALGMSEQTITTQKTLMVQPNMPRFLREGDQVEMITKISNLSDTALTGQASLQLIDAITNEPVDGLFQNVFPDQYFTAEAGRSTELKFPVTIPFNYNKPLTLRVIAKAGNYSDGEENTLPVLTNRMLVTESLPLYMHGDGTKQFEFEKLLTNNSTTLANESVTVEYSPNPVWYAVQALPYLIEYQQDCAEQTFNRFYANALAAYITAQHPRIKEVFEKWKTDTAALQSNIEKNPELKQVLLEETPWVLDAENETQQKKNIALLFDVVKMSSNMETALQQLKQAQMDNGAFPWFKGGYADRYITQYILTGIGRLKKLGAIDEKNKAVLNEIAVKSLAYLDGQINKDYADLKRNKSDLTKNNISGSQIQYLFMRSYFNDINIANKTAYNYYYQQSMKFWNKQSEYMKAMIASALYRTNQQTFAYKNIVPSILENAVEDSAKGMYWKNSAWGYYWYQSPIEQQALMIELMNEMAQQQKDTKMQGYVNNMRTWLLLNKQTNNWKTTKATADACYALLLNSNNELNNNRTIEIKLGDNIINSKEAEAGTGYFKQRINGADVKPEMGNITVTTQSTGQPFNQSTPSWGAVYWQYFEDLDKITAAATPLSLNKKLFVEKNTASGKVLSPVNDGDELQVGNKVIIRIELRSDRDMEYLHLKDMRAAAMEPTNVLSGYKWQDGLGYYEATKDASTNFFISYLNKGTYVFEYPVYITHEGTFSAGIATIQCMYAPEFSSHSEGFKINVAEAVK
ncbi:MAG TPA: alpha-2-macroglobulin family protein [Panacibacter sp.]|nr:alpha-2-macroglobulin family protein [Panacibacter sp.]